MNALVVGNRQDVTAFAFAGVEGVVCATREEAEAAIARAGDDRLVIVSGEVAPQESSVPMIVLLPRVA